MNIKCMFGKHEFEPVYYEAKWKPKYKTMYNLPDTPIRQHIDDKCVHCGKRKSSTITVKDKITVARLMLPNVLWILAVYILSGIIYQLYAADHELLAVLCSVILIIPMSICISKMTKYDINKE